MSSLQEYAERHGGVVDTSEPVRLLALYLIRTPPHKLVCDVHEFADGTVLLGRIPTAREDRKGRTIWKETHVDKIKVPNPDKIPSSYPGGAAEEVKVAFCLPGPTSAPSEDPRGTKQSPKLGQRLKRSAVPPGQQRMKFAR